MKWLPGLTAFAKATVVRQSFSDGGSPGLLPRHAASRSDFENIREARDALVDLLRLRIREVQPHEPVARRIGEEITARHEQHVLLDRDPQMVHRLLTVAGQPLPFGFASLGVPCARPGQQPPSHL